MQDGPAGQVLKALEQAQAWIEKARSLASSLPAQGTQRAPGSPCPICGLPTRGGITCSRAHGWQLRRRNAARQAANA